MEIIRKISIILFWVILYGCNKDVELPPVEYLERIEGIRLAWDFSSVRKLAPGIGRTNAYYARLIQRVNQQLICIYEVDGEIEIIVSNDLGLTWSNPVIVSKKENGVAKAVPEIVELQNHTLLASYNLRPSTNNQDPLKKFAIAVKLSSDGGQTWSNESIIYTADYLFINGCWEPSQIQLPSGELQLFFANEEPYRSTNEQDISMMRSYNNGLSWAAPVKVIFRAGKRDGMPVPLLLNDKHTILVSIEDNGYSAEFKPSVIKSDVIRNWTNAPVSGTSTDRYQPLKSYLSPEVYAGAPYLRQISTDEVIISYQSTANRQPVWDLSTMEVGISKDYGTTFNKITIPFNIPLSKRGLWNSLAIVNDMVWALTSTNAYNTSDRSEIMSIRSRTIPELALEKHDISVDGIIGSTEYGSQFPVFIGHKGNVNASIGLAENDGSLYLAALVTDNEVVISGTDIKAKDGITFYVDTNDNLAPSMVHEKVFAFTVTANSELLIEEGKYGNWEKHDLSGLKYKVVKKDSGYIIEMQIPLSELKSITSSEVWGFNVLLNNDAANYNYRYSENISGAAENDPSTWIPLTIPR